MFDQSKLIEEIYMYNNCKYIDIKNQKDKIKEEFGEVMKAIDAYIDNPSIENKKHLASELNDLKQSCHTLEVNNMSKNDRQDGNHKHIQKMIDRDNEK